jgi:kynurenine formamidase
MDEFEILELFQRCSNAGRWGTNDELGTLNYITLDKRVAAARLVTHGLVVALGRRLSTESSPENPVPITHRMLKQPTEESLGCSDAVDISPHGFAVTHVDALGHVFFEGYVWNGRKVIDVVRQSGLAFGSVEGLAGGVFTRGILLDIAAARGVDRLDEGDAVLRADLDRAEEMAGVRVGSGDAVIVRVGNHVHRGPAREERIETRRAGLAAECVLWLHEREVAVYGGDCIEQLPQASARVPMPLHMIGLVAMGLVILDNPEVEELAQLAKRVGRSEFLLTFAPLRIPGGTGSAVNPLAIF